MNTKYIYPGSRVKTLKTKLLSENQLERLLGSKDFEEFFKALQGTFLAEYLSKKEINNLDKALDESIFETKKVLNSIAPEKELLDVLWLKYDFHNLRAYIKGKISGLSNEEIKEKCFKVGKYDLNTFIKHCEEKNLNKLNKYLSEAYEKSMEYKKVSDIGININIYYFKAIREIAFNSKNEFLKEYISILINLFNLETKLRIELFRDKNDYGNIYISGGKFSKKEIENTKNVFDLYKTIGGEKIWNEAIEEYQKNGNISLIKKISENYVNDFLKSKEHDPFDLNSLFSYFSAQKNNIQTIKAVYVGKKIGISEYDIRFTLRKLYN